LKSVLNQSFEDYEIIVINDGSTDQSAELVKSFKSEKIKLFSQENLGASVARNNAVKLSKGQYLAFIDADDVWKNDHLECIHQSIITFPDCGLYATNYLIKHNKKYTAPAKLNIELTTNSPFKLKNFFKASLKDTIVWTSASCIEKSKFEAYGMFNPNYLSGQDLDLWIRIAINEPIVFHPKHTMIYNRSIENSLCKIEANEARFFLFNSFKKYEKNNPSIKEYLDLKRYGLALRTKINSELKIYKDTIDTIDISNLSRKQKLLLSTPAFILRILNKLRPIMIKNKFYLKIFKS
jgi:glycosyltransferase involved in cell wall biosynthesis